jgi:transcriptional regulator GlxA family with amidase domain
MAPVRFGIPLFEYQALDVIGPLDVIAGTSVTLLKQYEEDGYVPKGFHEKGLELEFYHISETARKSKPTNLELENLDVMATVTTADCPPIDYLLIGGPLPTFKLSEEMKTFIQDRVAKNEIKTIFTTCTGAAVLAQTGLLDGKRATVNLGMIDFARQMYPAVNWADKSEKNNWIIDGNIWTANGACTGMDMFAHWLIQQCGEELAKFQFGTLGFDPRGIDGKLLSL